MLSWDGFTFKNWMSKNLKVLFHLSVVNKNHMTSDSCRKGDLLHIGKWKEGHSFPLPCAFKALCHVKKPLSGSGWGLKESGEKWHAGSLGANRNQLAVNKWLWLTGPFDKNGSGLPTNVPVRRSTLTPVWPPACPQSLTFFIFCWTFLIKGPGLEVNRCYIF